MEPINDLDRLADELEHVNRDLLARGAGLEVLLRMMAERQASDLLLVAGEPPVFRVHGVVHRAEAALLDGEDIEQLITRCCRRTHSGRFVRHASQMRRSGFLTLAGFV